MQNTLPKLPIIIKQGATFDLPISYTDELGNPIVITGYTAKMQIRKTPEANNPPLLDLSTENGDIAIDGPNGIVEVTINRNITAALPPCWTGFYDLFIISPSDYWILLLEGTVYIEAAVTKSSSSSSRSSSSSSSSLST